MQNYSTFSSLRWNSFSKHLPLRCSAVVCVQVDSEEPVFEAVLNWVKHNRKEREPYLPDMLEFVRMPLLTPRYITDVIDAEVSQATYKQIVV